MLLQAQRQAGSIVDEGVPSRGLLRPMARTFGVEKLKRVEADQGTSLRSHRVVHGSKSRRVVGTVQGFKIKLAQVDAVPVERCQQPLHAFLDRCRTGWSGEVDQLAPVELGVLQGGGFLAAFRMVLPEAFADMRQLQPGVDQNTLAAASGDELVEIRSLRRVRVVIVPGGDVQAADSGVAPLSGEIAGVGAQPVRRVKKGPQPVAAKRRLQAQIGQRVQQIGKAFVASLARPDG